MQELHLVMCPALFAVMDLISFFILSAKYPPLRENQTGQCQNSSDPGHPGERLVQDQDRSHDGDYRGQVDIDAGSDRSNSRTAEFHVTKQRAEAPSPRNRRFSRLVLSAKRGKSMPGSDRSSTGIMKRSP